MTTRGSDRFRPSRAGVINVWDYVDEEFAFADGRLILRGHNGSGKTKALEVLFPFILDGYTDARRLDPFSGQNRTMKSNLLYRGQESEYGYVWMEFARPEDSAAAPETVTLVIGLRAHKHRDGVVPSFFVTDQRLGVDFGLLATDGRPLTEKQLKTALGEGAHHTSAADYRRAVDARLFGLGDRYIQLLDLLLALRRPLLAKDLDPEKVSDTLASGLSPLDEDLVDQAARDFANLAAVQIRFDNATAADEAVRTFLTEYADYLTTNARHRMARVTAAADQAAAHGRTVTEAAAEHRRATGERDTARAREEELTTRIGEKSAEVTALEADEALRDHDRLRERRQRHEEQTRRLAAQDTRLDGQAQEIAHLRTEAARVAERIERDRATARRLTTELTEAADRAGIHHDAEGGVDTGEDLPTTARARAAAREGDVRAVAERLDALDTAEAARGRAETASSRAADELTGREADCTRAAEELAALRSGAADAVRAWHERWDLVDDTGRGALLDALARLGEPGTPTLVEVFNEHVHDAQLEIAARVHGLERQETETSEELVRLRRERDDIAAERDDAPPADPLRPAPRGGRQGAPLWRLVRFADDLPEEHGAAVEGALHAAGMLTAWVHPDPALTRTALADGDSDAYLLPSAPHPGATLADVLVPEDQAHVPAETITRVLRSVPLHRDTGDAVTTTGGVDTGARFGLGVLVGSHPKAAAEYIGATNRAHRRRERLAACDARVAELTEHHESLRDQLGHARERLKDHGRARGDLPDPTPVAKAVRAVERHSTLLASARTAADRSRRDLDTAVAEVDAQRRRVRAVAAERAMPADRAGTDAVSEALTDFLATADALHTTRTDAAEYERDLAGRRETVDRLTAALESEREELAEQRAAHEEEAAALAAMESAIDAPVREILARLDALRAERDALTRERDTARTTAQTEHDRAIRSETRRDEGRGALTLALGALHEAVESLAEFTQPAVRAVMGVEPTTAWPDRSTWPTPEEMAERILTGTAETVAEALPDGVGALLEAFTATVGATPAVSESDIKSTATRMSNALRSFQETLGGDSEGYRVDHEVGPTGIITVFVNDEGGRNPVSAFARAIADRVEEQGALLREEEHQVLEDELLGGIAQQIHERVRDARDLVRDMDRDTRARPMSSGTRIGIRWVRDESLTDRERLATRLVKRDEAGLGPSGLAELRAVLRDMIRDHHAAHPRASYKQVLAAVLDYRDWYRFELRLAVPGQEEVRLTRNKHEQMSGGEKSAAIHLPLFAAANALYSSAAPTCPRVVALDEAFAGIDDRYKPELMGLTVTFGLDMFMTGHDLWVHYDTVPMAAHYDMHHDKGAHTVSALLMLWDGEQTIDADAGFSGNEELAAELLGITPSRFVPQSTEGTLLEEAG
ncbi:TIGR02680 family protein [Nocardiopsis sp. EMB25]|uniref:TIGR02680 family protein n=1 Tax=Nocardiopsis sp. EMB25 TaxID=2835867 RepID=UPI0022842183|nr:TIGR02680 family protein [Nocardiopsis sp. EMB25]MCY9784379.1 TIGR02680 family protein [Nocardiopsis sp. EMB25]